MNSPIERRDNLRKKCFDKDFEFVLNKNQKNHLMNKSNDLSVSGAEYMRLLIEQDILSEELSSLKDKKTDIEQKLISIQERLNRYRYKN